MPSSRLGRARPNFAEPGRRDAHPLRRAGWPACPQAVMAVAPSHLTLSAECAAARSPKTRTALPEAVSELGQGFQINEGPIGRLVLEGVLLSFPATVSGRRPPRKAVGDGEHFLTAHVRIKSHAKRWRAVLAGSGVLVPERPSRSRRNGVGRPCSVSDFRHIRQVDAGLIANAHNAKAAGCVTS